MSRIVKRVFYFKRFFAFVIVLCLVLGTATLIYSVEPRVRLLYEARSYYALTLTSSFDFENLAEDERQTQLKNGNLCVVVPYADSYFVCFEVYSNYTQASTALKEHRNNGRILSILYMTFNKTSVSVLKEETNAFKELYALSQIMLDRTTKLLTELQKRRISDFLAEKETKSIEADFLNTSASHQERTEDNALCELQDVYLILLKELETVSKHNTSDLKKQLNYFKLVFSVKFSSLINDKFH